MCIAFRYLVFTILLSTMMVDLPAADLQVKNRASYETLNHVSKNGVTFHFSKKHLVGKFVNDDWWVKGPVTIVSITPEMKDGKNGWEVNPVHIDKQPYDIRGAYYDISIMPTFPYVSIGNESIIKTVSKGENYPCRKGRSQCRSLLTDAVVLTVLNDLPIENSRNYFRPPYFGIEKPLINIKSLDLSQIPRLKSFDGKYYNKKMINEFKDLQLDHLDGWEGAFFHPINNMPNYGANIAVNTGVTSLLLLQDNDNNEKKKLTYLYLQAGLDWLYMFKNGKKWRADGGHSSGRKLPIIVSSILFDNNELKNLIKTENHASFGEDGQVYISKVNGKVLWGQQCTEDTYWRMKLKYGNGRACRDPYGLIDGPEGKGYQFCCTSKPWKAAALIGHVWPEVKSLWNNVAYFDYVDRWVKFGVVTSDDYCSNVRPQKLNGKCLPGNGRSPLNNNKFSDDGYYSHELIDSTWKRYRQ